MVQDGPKKRPRLALHENEASVVRRIFSMASRGNSLLDITRTLNSEGIASPRGKRWLKTTIHKILVNEAYTGTLLWGVLTKSKDPPVRVEKAFPAIVSKRRFKQVSKLMASRAPDKQHPRRVSSSYLLSGLVKCRRCRKSLTGQESKSGQFAYYVCQSLLKRGRAACDAPRLNARRFEGLIIDQIRNNILTESNIRELVKLVGEEMDGIAKEQRKRLKTIEGELADVKRWLDRLYRAIETTDLDPADLSPRIKEHRQRQEKLEVAAQDARVALSERREVLNSVDIIAAYARDMRSYLQESELTETKTFIRSFVKEIVIVQGTATIRYTLPMPDDSPIPGMDVEDLALNGQVPPFIPYGGPSGIRTLDTRIKSPVL